MLQEFLHDVVAEDVRHEVDRVRVELVEGGVLLVVVAGALDLASETGGRGKRSLEVL